MYTYRAPTNILNQDRETKKKGIMEYRKKVEKCYVCEGTGMHFGGNCCCDGTGSDVVRRQNQKSYNAKNGLSINHDVKPDALELLGLKKSRNN